MLVLTRRVGESIMIGDDVVITVVEMRGDVARLGIAAPRHVRVHREEVYREVAGANSSAATATASDASRLAALVTASRQQHPAGTTATGTNGTSTPSPANASAATKGALRARPGSSSSRNTPTPKTARAAQKPARVPKPAPPTRHETVDPASPEVPAGQTPPPVNEPTG